MYDRLKMGRINHAVSSGLKRYPERRFNKVCKSPLNIRHICRFELIDAIQKVIESAVCPAIRNKNHRKMILFGSIPRNKKIVQKIDP